MRLSPGQQAPPFVRTAIDGSQIDLTQYKGQKLLLSFYRYASCPFCNLRIHHFIERLPAYERSGLKTIAVFHSTEEAIAEFVGKQQPPFPIIADPKAELYKLYQLESSRFGYYWGAMHMLRLREAFKRGFKPGPQDYDPNTLPADFLIGPDQKIEVAFYGRHIADHIPFKTIEQWLAPGVEFAL